MKATTLRARVALQEIEAMGLTLDDLIAAAARGARRAPATTVAEYVEAVAESYQPHSRRTYNSYWRLTVELLGDLAPGQVGVDELIGVVDEAARPARQRRAGSDGRASRLAVGRVWSAAPGHLVDGKLKAPVWRGLGVRARHLGGQSRPERDSRG